MGTHHKKSGLYMARYTEEMPTGAKQKTIYGKTRREVDENLTKAKANRDVDLVFDADNLKVGQYLTRWLADSVQDTVKHTTYESYERLVRIHLVPTLGRIKLKIVKGDCGSPSLQAAIKPYVLPLLPRCLRQ